VSSLLVLIRRSRWRGTAPDFHGIPDAPADCLADLETEDNELSSWYVDDEKTNLNRILMALAANRDSYSNIDYVTFDFAVPQKFKITMRNTPGETADSHANRSWHYDLSSLSARQVVELAVDIFSSGSIVRVLPKEVQKRLVEACASDNLDHSKINKKLAIKLGVSGKPKSAWTRMCDAIKVRFGQ
jgi:hypothetical protein